MVQASRGAGSHLARRIALRSPGGRCSRHAGSGRGDCQAGPFSGAILFAPMAEKIIYQLQDLHKFYGQREVLKGITLSFLEGAKIGVIGPNGAGKSTLLRIIAGRGQGVRGHRQADRAASRSATSRRSRRSTRTKTSAGNLEEAVEPLRDIEARYYEVMNLMGEAEGDEAEKLNAEFDQLQHEMDAQGHLGARQPPRAGRRTRCRLPPMDADVKMLSGGERRRVALCKLLLEHPDMLLLDEPTNHLDAETIEWLEQHLAEYAGHGHPDHPRPLLPRQRRGLDARDRARPGARPTRATTRAYLEAEAEDARHQAPGSDAQREKVLERELRVARARRPRRARSSRKARLQRYKELRRAARRGAGSSRVELRIPPGPRLGDKVIEVARPRRRATATAS